MEKTKKVHAFLSVFFLVGFTLISCATNGSFMPSASADTVIGTVQISFVSYAKKSTRNNINIQTYIKLMEKAQEKFTGAFDVRDIIWTSGRIVDRKNKEISATGKVIKAEKYSDVGGQYHKISFYAYPPRTLIDGKKSLAGHVSLSIDRSGVWGFYPTTQGKLITKKGVVKYFAEYPLNQDYADFFVDEKTKNKLVEFIDKWKNDPPPFIIPLNDCVNFVRRACDIIGVKHSRALMPMKAVRDIRDRNVSFN
ncbi:MAG: hypothetical protein Ta2F_18820 [Termitinemataceae bacterium]|nr:MAG: hypothetical protein Ta2F_18820 [Termitinemataceae bacterium]